MAIKRAKRLKLPALAQIASSSSPLPISVFIHDFSLSGVGVESSQPLEIEEIVNFSFFLPLTKKFLIIQAEVKRCEKSLGTYILGLRFIRTKLRERIRLWREMRWLERHPLVLEEKKLMELAERDIVIEKTPEVDSLKEKGRTDLETRAERRGYAIPVRIGLETSPLPINGFIRDISLTGLGLKCGYPLEIDKTVYLSIFLPVSLSFLGVKVIVVRCAQSENDWICGLKFTEEFGKEDRNKLWQEVKWAGL